MKLIFCFALCMICTSIANAEESMNHMKHMSEAVSDNRELLNYTPDVRTHALANMRRHLQALSEIMDAFANAKYIEAADIADNRLGMNSQGAAGCRPDTMKMDMGMNMSSMTEADHLNHQMALLMPDKMRELGQRMHNSANEFAAKARDAAKDSKNIKDAGVALAKITQNCAACHEVYRMQ